nr:probable root meristem growth factor 8 [Ipomoea batatas]GMD51992.1 probable root meristem growth factor 8 [Ipomoea batatas]
MPSLLSYIPLQVQHTHFSIFSTHRNTVTLPADMEIMIRVITALCLILTAQEALGNTVSRDDQGTDNKQQIQFPAVNPRKLKLTNDAATVKSYGDDSHYHPTTVNKQEVALSGEKRHGREGKVGRHARKGTRQEWMEGSDRDTDMSEFYTMDYHWVRRRRPIHNKSFPFRQP